MDKSEQAQSNPWAIATARANTFIYLQVVIDAGDINIEPSDICYTALTKKGYIGYNLPESSTYEISYRSDTEHIVKSAYRETNGVEPVNIHFSGSTSAPDYCATLDYKFFNGRLAVEKVLELPDHPIDESYHDETHPSDYLSIAATFRFL